ncbi:hypothetical protein HDU82_006477 [Entophlyctis luteolus]|nr:hypothetical protein HDU82_006477 [Entophlyctis luteolus]
MADKPPNAIVSPGVGAAKHARAFELAPRAFRSSNALLSPSLWSVTPVPHGQLSKKKVLPPTGATAEGATASTRKKVADSACSPLVISVFGLDNAGKSSVLMHLKGGGTFPSSTFYMFPD